MANQSINIQFTTTGSVVFGAPVQQVTLLDATNINFLRQMFVSNDGIRIVKGQSSCRIPVSQLYAAAVAADPTLTWAPKFTTNPSNITTASTAVAPFNVVVQTELPVQYTWQTLSASSTVWFNTTLSASVFTGSATPALTASCFVKDLNGWEFRCVATSSAGTTTSSFATLTVT